MWNNIARFGRKKKVVVFLNRKKMFRVFNVCVFRVCFCAWEKNREFFFNTLSHHETQTLYYECAEKNHQR